MRWTIDVFYRKIAGVLSDGLKLICAVHCACVCKPMTIIHSSFYCRQLCTFTTLLKALEMVLRRCCEIIIVGSAVAIHKEEYLHLIECGQEVNMSL